MVFIDHKGNLRIKIVIYGPVGSGKTTLLKRIVEMMAEKWKARVNTIEDIEGNTLFFDFAPMQFRARPIAVDIFSVPGKRYHQHQRGTVLKGADVVVFLGDYTVGALDRNIASLEELVTLIQKDTPVIIAMNKYDLVFRLDLSKLKKEIPEELKVVKIMNVSALMGYNIEEVFKEALMIAIQSVSEAG